MPNIAKEGSDKKRRPLRFWWDYFRREKMKRTISALLGLLALGLIPVMAQSSIVVGYVFDQDNRPLSSVRVLVEGNNKEALTDGKGSFRFQGLALGDQTLNFVMDGYETAQRSVEIVAGVQIMDSVTMKREALVNESIQVIGSLRDSQAKAINMQRLAPNIVNIVAADQMGQFPDTNAAEATQRVPGVNIARDQGEGRYVLIRGTEARLNHTTINGVDIPAPEGDLRTVALDVIPIDLLEAVEIAKTITPDMDGDVVGGNVNLRMKRAKRHKQYSVGVDYGYNQLSEDAIQAFQASFSNGLGDDRVGFTAAFTYDETDRGTHNFEAEYDDGELDNFELRDYYVNRERLGVLASLDFQVSQRSNVQLDASFSQFDDQEFRYRYRHRIGDERLERELKDRFESQEILTLHLHGETLLDSGSIWRYSVAFGHAQEEEPTRFDTTFRQKDVVFDPNWNQGTPDFFNAQPNPQNEDYQEYELDEIAQENNISEDDHLKAEISLDYPVTGENAFWLWKFGAKFRTKEKMRDNQVTVFEADDVAFVDYIDSAYRQNDFFGGRYQMGSFHSRNTVKQILALPGVESEHAFEEDAADYEVEEQTIAAYAMSTVEWGDQWELLGGLRVESLDNSYTGYEVLFDDEGDFASLNPVNGEKTDEKFLPMFHAKYKINEKQNLRFALTQTYARPRVYDAVPYRLILDEDAEIEMGNPDIEMTDVTNVDLLYENYFDAVGLISVGLFYKDLSDYIYIYQSDAIYNGEEYEVTQPRNGPEATLWGLEFAFQKSFANGFGLYFNYTYTDSEATLEVARPDLRLPGQSEKTGNLAFTFEKKGFTVRLAGSLHGKYQDTVAEDPMEDVWVDDHLQWDMTAGYQVGNLHFSLELINLNDEKVILFQGAPEFPIQYEQYKMWGRMGVKYVF
jgi:TonB-dependent receptor